MPAITWREVSQDPGENQIFQRMLDDDQLFSKQYINKTLMCFKSKSKSKKRAR